MSKLELQIEALLFYKNEPIEIRKISKILEAGKGEVREALGNLSKSLENRGICLIMTENEVSLATAPELKGFMERVAQDEMNKDISKASLETLAIILYNGPISRREVDYIRGVNSTFILRNLCVRGLVEKEVDSRDQRVFRYKSSLPLLAHLGLKRVEELPRFETLKNEVITKEKDVE